MADNTRHILTNLLTTFISTKLNLDLTTSMLLMSVATPFLLKIDWYNMFDYISILYCMLCCILSVIGIVVHKKYYEDKIYSSVEVDLSSLNPYRRHIMILFESLEAYHPGSVSKTNHLIEQGCIRFPQYGTKIRFNDTIHNVSGYITSKSVKTTKVEDDKNITKACDFLVVCVKQPIDVIEYLKELDEYISKKTRENIIVHISVKYYVGTGDNMYIDSRRLYTGKKEETKHYDIYMKTFFSRDKERLYNYLYKIKNNPEYFLNLGQFPQCNLLLYGPPGTGKSTFVYRLAMCLFMPVRIINISEYLNDTITLRNIFVSSDDYICLLEEFDNTIRYLLEQKEKETKEINEPKILEIIKNKPQKPLRVEDLLDILQGSIPNTQRIIIATTNHFDYVYGKCPALFRPGRLTPVKFDYLDWPTLQELSNYYFNQSLSFKETKINIPTSQIIELALEAKMIEENQFKYFEDKLQRLITS